MMEDKSKVKPKKDALGAKKAELDKKTAEISKALETKMSELTEEERTAMS